jgi:hypothetical protein
MKRQRSIKEKKKKKDDANPTSSWHTLTDDILVEIFLLLNEDFPSQFAFLWTTKEIKNRILNTEHVTYSATLFIAIGLVPIMSSIENENIMLKTLACNEAALLGYGNLIEWYKAIGCQWNPHRLCSKLARGGHLALLKSYKKDEKSWDSYGICRNAAKGNHIAILKWASKKGLYKKEQEEAVADIGAIEGLVDVMKFVKNQNRDFNFTQIHSYHVISSGNLEAVKWMWEKCGYMLLDSSLHIAASLGYLDIFTWLLGKCYVRNTTELYYCAARGGKMNIIEFCLTKGYALDSKVAACAARCFLGVEQETRKLLESLRTKQCPWDARTCSKLAGAGYLETLKWARSEGCPWDASTCAKAAKYGELEILQYARQEGCPWDEETPVNALKHSHYELLLWAMENGAPSFIRMFVIPEEGF